MKNKIVYANLKNSFQINWAVNKIGFGEFYFYLDDEDNKIRCSNELMSKEFIKEILCKMVDNCILDNK